MQRHWGKNSVLKLSAKFPCVHPNQSLKLTDKAVDDFAARQKIFKGKVMPAARIVYMELAARRRSLAPVR